MPRLHDRQTSEPQGTWPARTVATFEDRYGAGRFEILLELFAQPCLTYAEIATRFNVTRERVRQWHLELLPDAPRGHARQRQCWIYQQKRRLLADPLFRGFYQHARPHFPASRFGLIGGRDGFHKRAVRLDGRTIALRSARPLASPGGAAWALGRSPGEADFIYYRLGDSGFLLLPRAMVAVGARISESAAPELRPYWNSFAAVLPPELGQRAS